MTTRELYSSIGVSGYEHQGCWRKDGKFHIRMEAPAACHKCPKCGKREAIHRGTFDRVVHAADRSGADGLVYQSSATRVSALQTSPECGAAECGAAVTDAECSMTHDRDQSTSKPRHEFSATFFKPFQLNVELANLGVQAFRITLWIKGLGATLYVKQLAGIFQ